MDYYMQLPILTFGHEDNHTGSALQTSFQRLFQNIPRGILWNDQETGPTS